MAFKETYETRTESLLAPILEAGSYDLWDVEFVKEGADWYLRIYVDKEGGITIDDCVEISHSIEAKLDAEDFIKEAYILEVSSPGLGRQLKKDRDFEKSIGKDVEVKLFKAVDGVKEFEGTLTSYTKDSITITMDENEQTFSRKEIAIVRLALDF